MKRILLVEPNARVAGHIKQFLERDNKFIVTVAPSAEQAIYAADEQQPDVVVLELAMPKHNGFAFLHEFRSYQEWANIPVIVHSHLATQDAAQTKAWETLGAVAYLYKPQTSLARLRQKVGECLEEVSEPAS